MNNKTIGHNRRSVRLAGYDYSKEGMYFITVCTQNKECLLGKIIEGKIELNNAGNMVKTVWNELPKFYPDVAIDVCQIMPNHIHGIIVLVGAGPCACPSISCACPSISSVCKQFPYDNKNGQLSLPDVVHRFKTMTMKLYIDGVKNDKWPRFSRKLWQRNYYEHIIRDEDDLSRICNYVVDNPLKWEEDEYYV